MKAPGMPRCGCGSAKVVAVAPGAEPVSGGDRFGEIEIALRLGTPVQCWCAACWARRFGPRVAAGG